MKFIDVIIYPGLPQDSAGENPAADVSDGKTIRARRIEKEVRRLATSSARHELTYNLGISGNVFRQIGRDGSRTYVSRAAWLASLNQFYGLSLIIRRLRKNIPSESHAENTTDNPNYYNCCRFHFCLLI
jgi:hypothetical protein